MASWLIESRDSARFRSHPALRDALRPLLPDYIARFGDGFAPANKSDLPSKSSMPPQASRLPLQTFPILIQKIDAERVGGSRWAHLDTVAMQSDTAWL